MLDPRRWRPWRPGGLHVSDRPSTTAGAVTLWRALEARRPPADRIVDDGYAELFLPPGLRMLIGPLDVAAPLRDLAARQELGGLSTYVLCRHRLIDEHLRAALDAGAAQVVILGAGYDSRPYRFATQLSGRPVFEVDLAALSRRKAAIVAAHPERFGTASAVRRVEIDFRTQSLADRLESAGFSRGAGTFVVWEGVVPYLDRAAVDRTLASLRSLCGPGSVLALDLWDGTGGPGRLAPLRRLGTRAITLMGEPVTFGVVPGSVAGLLGGHGFVVSDLADAGDLASRYATAGRRSIESLFVVACRLS